MVGVVSGRSHVWGMGEYFGRERRKRRFSFFSVWRQAGLGSYL